MFVQIYLAQIEIVPPDLLRLELRKTAVPESGQHHPNKCVVVLIMLFIIILN